MTRLKTKIAKHDYEVEAELVAEEIIRKVRLIRLARRQLVSGPGRNPEPKLRGL